ncbi:Hsp70 family protein [Rhodococcus aetherivorans]|uniref:Hsp70 family protein n=1 Tax=Rhodococcus aetherivorans TaxID=191292 RepID=UPI003C6E7EA3
MTVVGFDFGTTNSLISIVEGNRVIDLVDTDGRSVPSVVQYEGTKTIVGRDAKEAMDATGLGVYANFITSPKTWSSPWRWCTTSSRDSSGVGQAVKAGVTSPVSSATLSAGLSVRERASTSSPR